MIDKFTKNSIQSTKTDIGNLKLSVSSTQLTSPLGNITNNFATPIKSGVSPASVSQKNDVERLKYDFRKKKIERKKKVGQFVKRVSYCGCRTINKDSKFVNAVKGEKGGIFYQNMQRCGSVWFCPDCMYKLMKERALELSKQLSIYNKDNKTVLFVTFTIQHNNSDSLEKLHNHLLSAFTFANSHRSWKSIQKSVPSEYLRALEVLKGSNGWHPHLHCLFVGNEKIEQSINVFTELYKKKLKQLGYLTNEHTVDIDKWNGKIGDMEEYLFKGLLEKEITGGNLTKKGSGKTFFELIDNQVENEKSIKEYIKVMKGKRQYHKSKGFFTDIKQKTDEEILIDDKVDEILFTIPINIYADMVKKGIELHVLNEYSYGGKKRVIRFLELYDVETNFLEN